MSGTEIIEVKETKQLAKTLLGCDGGSLIKLLPDGTVKSVLKKVRLHENQKHIYFEKTASQWLITLEGYKELVKFTDLKIMSIPYMITNGQRVDNPFYETDSSGKLIRVIEEITVVGRTPQGDIAFSRARVIGDINAMLTKKIIKAAEYDESLGQFCDYETYLELRKTSSVFFFPVNEQSVMGQTMILGYAIDLKNKKAFELIRKHQDEVEHEYKKVGAKAFRNAVKSHPAINKYVVSPTDTPKGKIVDVTVIQWTTDFTAEELKQIQDYKESGYTSKPDYETMSDEDVADITELDQEEFETIEDMEPVEPQEQKSDPKAEIIEYIEQAKDILPAEMVQSIVLEFWNKPIESAPILVLKSIKNKINQTLEA